MGGPLLMNENFDLTMDNLPVKVEFDGRNLFFKDTRVSPKRASLDVRRVIPAYIAIIIVVAIFVAGMTIGALFGEVMAAILSVSVAGGISAVVFIALSRVEQILVIDSKSGSFEFKGSNDDLRSLYYEISKITIRKMKEKEKKEAVSMKGVGVTKGENLFDKKDLGNIRKDLKKSGIINKKMVTQICPECGHDELYFEGGLMAGHVYHCKKCDYVGSFVLEKEIDFKDVK
jgi:predicted RNA-binding Zn-ribbon protein involved in translation (DUF1610 family)